jgi:predicted dinucleotide-binding enzyme
MAAKKTIAIVGATGKTGAAISRKLVSVGNRVLLIAKNKSKLDILEEDIKRDSAAAEVEVIECLKDGCWEADIIILAIPSSAEKEVAANIKEVATQKIVVRIFPVENITAFTTNEMDSLQQLLPNSKIVSAFINPASLYETTVTGSDEEAVQTVIELAVKAGCIAALATEL